MPENGLSDSTSLSANLNPSNQKKTSNSKKISIYNPNFYRLDLSMVINREFSMPKNQ